MSSKSIVQAIDKLAPPCSGVAPHSKSIIQALDRLAGRIDPFVGVSALAVAPYERTFAFRAEGTRRLYGPVPPGNSFWYYDLSASLRDLSGDIPGAGHLESVLSWFPAQVGPVVLNIPPAALANPPYDKPPANGYKGTETNAETLGTTKTRLVFPDGSTIVSIGVNQTKIMPYADGSAQLFETNTEVIATGSGRFAGARGLVTSDLGAYFSPLVPLDPTKEPYKSGYPVKVFVFIRLTTRPGPPAPAPPAPSTKGKAQPRRGRARR